MRDIVRWSAGAVSGLALFFGVFSLSLLNFNGGLAYCVFLNQRYVCGPYALQIVVEPQPDSLALQFAVPLLALALVVGLPLWISIPLSAERRGRTIRALLMIIALLATALLTVDMIILLSQIGPLSAPQVVCLSDGSGGAYACYRGGRALLLALAGTGGASLVGALLAGTPAWVIALVQTARWRRWGWFAAVLLFSPIAALLYACFGPSQPMRSAAARSTPAVAPTL